jgi:ferredoxin/flavodoxin
MSNSIQTGVLFFSPTDTTRKICQAIAQGIGDNQPKDLNITLPPQRDFFNSNAGSLMAEIEHLVVGAPVYNGKLPLQAIEVLKTLPEKEMKCTIAVVYGNRDYGIALRQMAELLTDKGYQVVGAGAFIGQHSYSDVIPVAMGRPDKSDLEIATSFGEKCRQLVHPMLPKDLPVQLDMFSKSEKYTPLKPVFYPDRCTECGECAETCPTGIISVETGGYIHDKADDDCIGCMACVNSCENEARLAKPGWIMKQMIRYILRKAATERLEPITLFKKQPVPAA